MNTSPCSSRSVLFLLTRCEQSPEPLRELKIVEQDMLTIVQIVIQAWNLVQMFIIGHFFRKKCQPRQKFNMAAIFQDGRRLAPCYVVLLNNHSAMCVISMKFDNKCSLEVTFLEKSAIHKKNSIWPPFLSKWLPVGPLRCGFKQKEQCKL